MGPPVKTRGKVGEVLVEMGVITPLQLDEARMPAALQATWSGERW